MKILKTERIIYLSLLALLTAALIASLLSPSVLGAFGRTELAKFDLNEDGAVDVRDATHLLNFLSGAFSLPDKAPEIDVSKTDGKVIVRVTEKQFAGKEVSFLLLTDKNARKTWSEDLSKLVDLDQAAFDENGNATVELSDVEQRAACLVVTVEGEEFIKDL